MGQADWMIPRPSLAAQAQLQHSLQVLQALYPREHAQVVSLAGDLMSLNMHYKTLLNQAIGHIMELEVAEVLRERTPAQPGACKVSADS
jgi:hypothetical protein